MKILKILALGLLIVAALVVILSLFLPKNYHVERTVTIAAPPQQVHRLTSDLSVGWPQWEPWSEADDTIVTTLGDVTEGVGASQSWTGASGDGELMITFSDEARGVEYEMFMTPGNYSSTGGIRYVETPDGTKVTWWMDGRLNGVLGKYVGLMMDRLVGPMFEQGLENLKTAAEALPPAEEPVDEAANGEDEAAV